MRSVRSVPARPRAPHAPHRSSARRVGRVGRTVAAALLVAAVSGACSDDEGGTDTFGEPVRGAITVSAAASLTDAMEEITDRFVEEYPEAAVDLNLGSSGQLSAQVQEGAPADVVAFAGPAPMDDLETADLLSTQPVEFARNRLVVVTPPGNPAGVEELSNLADTGTGVVALCATSAPCGSLAREMLDDAGVEIPERNVTVGQDVRATLGAVTRGDAVAAVVYATDAAVVGDAVDVVEVPEAERLVARYPIAVVDGAPNPAAAAEFVRFVTGEQGRTILERAGFGLP